MKLLLALTLTVAVVSAHWTHDESLAREIGAPPGEEDVDVGSLADELISEKEGVGEETTYRVTIGTRAMGPTKPYGGLPFWYGGGSNQQVRFAASGSPSMGAPAGALEGDRVLRYYQGPAMTYKSALKLAPQLHPGLAPLITNNNFPCAGKDPALKVNMDCNKHASDLRDASDKLTWCEPNNKACLSAIDGNMVGYAEPPVTKLQAGISTDSGFFETGMIQRAQVEMKDVGEILEVQMREDASMGSDNPCIAAGKLDYQCSSPWYPSFVKVNTNNPKTGIGNGVYYIKPGDTVHVGTILNDKIPDQPAVSEYMKLIAKPGEIPEDLVSHNSQLTKCIAQTCEEEMDTKLGMSQLKDEEFTG